MLVYIPGRSHDTKGHDELEVVLNAYTSEPAVVNVNQLRPSWGGISLEPRRGVGLVIVVIVVIVVVVVIPGSSTHRHPLQTNCPA